MTDIKHLSEDKGKGIVFTFGRFNPPHTGHELLVSKLEKTARRLGFDSAIYVSQSSGNDKNPLKYREKIKFLRSSFRNTEVVEDTSLNNPFHVAKKLSDDGYKHVVLVVGGDRTADLERGIRKYIGHSDPDKSFEFDTFKVVSAGKRDPDADDLTGMSASKMRFLAKTGDVDNFIAGSPSGMSKRDAKKMYDSIREALGVRESIDQLFDRLDLGINEEELIKEAFLNLDLESLQYLGLMEENGPKPTVVVLTTYEDEDDLSDTTSKIEKACEKHDMPFYAVSIDDAYVVDKDMDDDKITIHNYDGENNKLNLTTSNTICIPRGSVLTNHSGVGILSVLQDTDMFTVNKISSLELCSNKFATAIALERGNVDSPRTALVANEDAIDIAMKKIGDKFPVVLKTITGAEGIGVSLIDSRDSLLGVLQSLWKFNAELILQEYFKIDHDIRTIILDGQVVASVKRIKGSGDFRTNKALGNDTEPYELSEEEEQLVLKAAKISGCYWCGVDHIETEDGEYKVLEVNGSPGSGAEPFIGYFNDEPEEVSGQEVVDHIMEYISREDNWQKTTTTVGAIEEVEIEGIGKMDARIDTGNEGYNVLHAENIEHDEKFNMVSFETNGETITLPLDDVVRINIGSGEIRNRMVVKIDITIGDKKYKDVHFSLSDRDENDTPVLIGRRFLKMANFSVDINKSYELKEDIDSEFESLMV